MSTSLNTPYTSVLLASISASTGFTSPMPVAPAELNTGASRNCSLRSASNLAYSTSRLNVVASLGAYCREVVRPMRDWSCSYLS